MAKVEIYTTNYCPYCTHAKNLFKNKGVEYTEIDMTDDDEMRADIMVKTNGARTVPQIFINGEHIGGFDDTAKLDKEGKLDALLAK